MDHRLLLITAMLTCACLDDIVPLSPTLAAGQADGPDLALAGVGSVWKVIATAPETAFPDDRSVQGFMRVTVIPREVGIDVTVDLTLTNCTDTAIVVQPVTPEHAGDDIELSTVDVAGCDDGTPLWGDHCMGLWAECLPEEPCTREVCLEVQLTGTEPVILDWEAEALVEESEPEESSVLASEVPQTPEIEITFEQALSIF